MGLPTLCCFSPTGEDALEKRSSRSRAESGLKKLPTPSKKAEGDALLAADIQLEEDESLQRDSDERLKETSTTGTSTQEQLKRAVQRQDLTAVQRLIAGGEVDPGSVIESDGSVLLHLACSRGSLDIVKALVLAGALVDAQSDSGFTPLHRAAMEGHASICEFLLEAGANIASYNKKVSRVVIDVCNHSALPLLSRRHHVRYRHPRQSESALF